MKFADFAAQLTSHPDLELVFEFNDAAIRPDYHLTEVVRSSVDAIDCGGAVDHWTEAVLQLIQPAHAECKRYLTAGKVWSILQRSQALVPIPDDSTLLLEFRGDGVQAAQRFHVTATLANTAGQLRVLTEGAPTQCKAVRRNQSTLGTTAAPSACSTPSASIEASGVTCCSQGAASTQDIGGKACCA